MSHIDAPLRPRRHSAPPPIGIRRGDATAENTNDTFDDVRDALQAPTSSRPQFASAPLKTLLPPAQLELRRVSAGEEVVALRPAHPRGPQHFSTDPTFHLHKLVARQSAGQSTSAALNNALGTVGASTDCAAVVQAYGGSLPRPVVNAVCVRRRAAVRALAAESSASSSSVAVSASSRRAAASSSRAVASSSRSAAAASAATRAATRLAATRLQTTARFVETPRVAAPITTSLDPALDSYVSSQFAEAASVVTSRASALSVSRAALQTSVDSLFSEALSEVSSRRAPAAASSTTPSSSSMPPSSSSMPPSSSSSIPSSSVAPSSTTSGVDPSTTIAPARSNHNRIAKIVGPSVAIPLGLLLLALLACLCVRRRRRKRATGLVSGRSTPAIGPISNPQPMQGTQRQYGAMARFAPGAAVGAGVGAAAGTAAIGATRGNGSQESVGTTPSAIGVAFSEPRTKWGRRSLVDVLAGGVRSADSGSGSPSGSAGGTPDRQYRGVSGTSSFGGRQPSITSLVSGSIPSEYRGVGGYNSFGYQPGQMRPVMTPLGTHYDPFGPSAIVPVPASAQRHHPISSEEGSISGYGSGEDDVPRRYTTGGSGSGSASGESITARLAPPLAAGYAHSPQAQQSRTTQATSGEEGYYTADPGASSHDEHETETLSEVGLHEFGVGGSPEAASVNFGSGSSGSASGSAGGGSGGHHSLAGSVRSAVDDPNATPRVGSRTSTPRLGTGHGSLGNRRNDGSGSWWN